MKQAPKKRLKTKAITVYIDPMYTDKVDYLKHNVGLTRFIEKCLSEFQVDPKIMAAVKLIEDYKKKEG